MSQLSLTSEAVQDLARCRRFLFLKSPSVARRADSVIADALSLLKTTPEMGRPYRENPILRELIIKFGNSGYLALYRYDPDQDAVHVLAFKHALEEDY